MWPWGHLAVGYLLYVAVISRDIDRVPDDWAVLILALATQLPDIVDKTLAWYLGVLPNGRSLAHSVVFATVVLGAVGLLAAHFGQRDLGVAGSVGYFSHLAADAFAPLVALDIRALGFLVWPILPAVQEPGSPSVLGYFAELAADLAAGHLSAFFAFELALTVIAVALWSRHGYPGAPLRWRRRDPSGPIDREP